MKTHAPSKGNMNSGDVINYQLLMIVSPSQSHQSWLFAVAFSPCHWMELHAEPMWKFTVH